MISNFANSEKTPIAGESTPSPCGRFFWFARSFRRFGSLRSAALLSLVCFSVGWTASTVINAGDDARRMTQQELDLIKEVYKARENYQLALERLTTYYVEVADEEGRGSAETELRDYHRTVKPPYSMDLDLPGPDLKPSEINNKANAMFRESMEWINRTGFGDRGDDYKRAELLLRKLLREYPKSDKLDETCYFLGEIYAGKYFNQPRRAVGFYERVFKYEPNTSLDARYRAAVIYDRTLGDRRRALELYQEVLKRDVDPKQTREARRRIDEFLGSRR